MRSLTKETWYLHVPTGDLWKSKNIRKWWRPDKERNIQIINNGGWHFKDIFTPKELSIKLKTFAHKEFSVSNFSNLRTIRDKIREKRDLYNKNQLFYKVELNKNFPKYILDNQKKFKSFISWYFIVNIIF